MPQQTVMKGKVISPLFLEELIMVTCNTFLAKIENNVLHHIPVGRVFPLDGTPPHFSCHVHAFLDKQVPDHWIGRGEPIP